MTLHMEIPDVKSWLLGLSSADLEILASMSEGKLEDLDSRMESGEIVRQPASFLVPMVKQNNKWCFQVTEEMEKTFFGGLYSLFDQAN